MIVQTASQNEWMYPDSTVRGDVKNEVSLNAARRSRVSTQVLINNLAPGESLRVYCEGIPFDCEVYQMVDVPVEVNTGPVFATADSDKAKGYITRKAPFRVYDALKPVNGETVLGKGTECFYLCWNITADAQPCVYQGSIRLETGDDIKSIPVKIKVYDAVLPEKETLRTTNWYSTDNICKWHNVEIYSPAFWEMLRKYFKAMRREHQTCIYIDFGNVKVTKDKEGRFSFDFSIVEKIIRMALNEGFQYIEGGHLMHLWGNVLRDDAYSSKLPEWYGQLEEFLKAWGGFLKENGWYEKAMQHVGDEPPSHLLEKYCRVASLVKKYLPGISVLDAIDIGADNELHGSVDIWVLGNKYYQENIEFVEKMRREGENVWYYTCCAQVGYYINRTMDIPLIKSRYLPWANFRYGIEGYLHWGFNQYQVDQNPFKRSCTRPGYYIGTVYQAGDTHLVYPGDDGPWYSMRLEAIRSGMEDYELLAMLSRRNRELAQRIAASCVKRFDDVELDIDQFENSRIELLESLERYNKKI